MVASLDGYQSLEQAAEVPGRINEKLSLHSLKYLTEGMVLNLE